MHTIVGASILLNINYELEMHTKERGKSTINAAIATTTTKWSTSYSMLVNNNKSHFCFLNMFTCITYSFDKKKTKSWKQKLNYIKKILQRLTITISSISQSFLLCDFFSLQ